MGGIKRPDVDLLPSLKPLLRDCKVVIRHWIEVTGSAVSNESYDLGTVARELRKDDEKLVRQWVRRLKCSVVCRPRRGFSACLTCCLFNGECCDEGHRPCCEV